MLKIPKLTFRRALLAVLVMFGLAVAAINVAQPASATCSSNRCEQTCGKEYTKYFSAWFGSNQSQTGVKVKFQDNYKQATVTARDGYRIVAVWYDDATSHTNWINVPVTDNQSVVINPDASGYRNYISAVKVTVIKDCPVDVIPGCTNPEATNFNKDATEDDGSCKFKETPEPTTSPEPTAQPEEKKSEDKGEHKSKPNPKHTSLSYETNCTDGTITAQFRSTDNGNGVEHVDVTFKYDNKEVKTTSNSTGYAYATFPYASSKTELSAEGVGFGSQRAEVEYVCTGQVLGASTEMSYANTGTFADRALIGLMAVGVLSISAGAWLQIKQS